MPTIYTHPNCPTFTVSPLLMLTHLKTTHPLTTTRTLAAHGTRGLTVLKHHLHLTPHLSTAVYPCLDCNLVFNTAIESHAHLVSAATHHEEVLAARERAGEEGVAELVRTAWLEKADVVAQGETKMKWVNEVYVNEELGQLNIGQLAPVVRGPGGDAVMRGPISLALTVEAYSRREHFPPRVMLQARGPRNTMDVVALAACFEEAWIRKGGEAGKVSWERMLRAVGMRVGGVEIKSDEEVVGWVSGAGMAEMGSMRGKGADRV